MSDRHSNVVCSFCTITKISIKLHTFENLIEWTNGDSWELRELRPTMPVLVTAQYSLFSWMSTVRNSMWSRLLVNKITGFKPSMSADATLAGMPLSVPWSVQYSLLRGHSRMEVRVWFSNIYNIVMDLYAYYFLIALHTLYSQTTKIQIVAVKWKTFISKILTFQEHQPLLISFIGLSTLFIKVEISLNPQRTRSFVRSFNTDFGHVNPKSELRAMS